MEYFELGDLQRYLGKPLPEADGQKISFQLLKGLQFMHDNGFAHRDLKLANILIASKGPDWRVKIGDFGLSKRVDQDMTVFNSAFGTNHYLAPEVLLDGKWRNSASKGSSRNYTPPVDIWSLRVIAFRILAGTVPFADLTSLFAYAQKPNDAVFEALIQQGVSDSGQDFVRCLLRVDPTDRPSAEAALSHEWRSTTLVSDETPEAAYSYSNSARTGSAEASGRWSALDSMKTDMGIPVTGLRARGSNTSIGTPTVRPNSSVGRKNPHSVGSTRTTPVVGGAEVPESENTQRVKRTFPVPSITRSTVDGTNDRREAGPIEESHIKQRRSSAARGRRKSALSPNAPSTAEKPGTRVGWLFDSDGSDIEFSKHNRPQNSARDYIRQSRETLEPARRSWLFTQDRGPRKYPNKEKVSPSPSRQSSGEDLGPTRPRIPTLLGWLLICDYKRLQCGPGLS